MRLIDADELQKYICEECIDSTDCERCFYKSVIDAQPTVSNIVWHPYPEEIPPVNKWYLLTVNRDDGTPMVITYYYSEYVKNDTITAWAEMPAPYGGV